jgi:hypothetical protein
MAKSIPMQRFLQALFGDRKMAAPAAEIGRAILAARSLRRTEVAAKMKGKAEAAYKRIQRFLRRVDPRPVWRRLFREEAEAPPRWNAPRPGRPNPWGRHGAFGSCFGRPPIGGGPSPVGRKTIADRGDSRNQNPMRAIETRKDIVGDRPVGSYLGFWQDLEAAQVSFVLRRNQGTHPKFQDSEGREPAGPESGLSGCGVQGVVGLWERGHAEPLGTGTADGPPTDEDRCDLSGPEGPAGLGTPDESVAGVHGKDGGLALSGTSWGRIGGISCTGRRLRSRGNPASLPTRRSQPGRLPRPSLPPSPGILRPRPGQAGSATPVCSYSSCRSGSGRLSRGGPSSGRLWLPSWLSSFLLSQLMSEPETRSPDTWGQ